MKVKIFLLTSWYSGPIRVNPDHIITYQLDEKDGYGNVINGSIVKLINGDQLEVKENPEKIDRMYHEIS